METMVLPGTVTGVRGLSSRLGEPGWLADWRVRAFEHWQASELPIRANHLWRYTDPTGFDPAGDPFAIGSGGWGIGAVSGREGREDAGVSVSRDAGVSVSSDGGRDAGDLILTDLAPEASDAGQAGRPRRR